MGLWRAWRPTTEPTSLPNPFLNEQLTTHLVWKWCISQLGWLVTPNCRQTDRPTRKLNLPCDDARRERRDKTANASELSFVSRRPVIVYQTPHLGLKNGLSFLLDIRIWFCDKPFFKPTLILQNRHPRSGQRSSPIGMFLVYFLPEVAGGQVFRLFLGSRHIYHNESTLLIINEKCVILVPWVLG